MMKKIPYILLFAVLILSLAIVIKGISSKRQEKEENIENARKTAVENSIVSTEKLYEFYQTNPENGLAVIYKFETGNGNGRITVENGGETVSILCAVKEDKNVSEFIFVAYEESSKLAGDFSVGDVLVRLHKKEKAIVPEWVAMECLFPGEEVVRNY